MCIRDRLGAVLVWLWQWVAVGIAGFLAGGYLTGHILQASGMATGSMSGGLLVLGGLVGALLMIAVFDWALILLSAFSGATVIIQELAPERLPALGLFVGLVAVGLVVQGRFGRPPSTVST